jgi:hypothetical protein
MPETSRRTEVFKFYKSTEEEHLAMQELAAEESRLSRVMNHLTVHSREMKLTLILKTDNFFCNGLVVVIGFVLRFLILIRSALRG